jgi:phage shock protein E
VGMRWTTLLVIAAIIVIVFLLKRTGEIPTAEAAEQLKKGAVVIDVRSPGEYNAEHLPAAINLPLDGIELAVPQRVPDKDRVLLLHCQSGMRSAMALRKLQAIGYTNVFNLGSLGRAREIVGKAGGD